MNSTKGSPLGTNKRTTRIDMKVLLSALWIGATLNYIYIENKKGSPNESYCI